MHASINNCILLRPISLLVSNHQSFISARCTSATGLLIVLFIDGYFDLIDGWVMEVTRNMFFPRTAVSTASRLAWRFWSCCRARAFSKRLWLGHPASFLSQARVLRSCARDDILAQSTVQQYCIRARRRGESRWWTRADAFLSEAVKSYEHVSPLSP